MNVFFIFVQLENVLFTQCRSKTENTGVRANVLISNKVGATHKEYLNFWYNFSFTYVFLLHQSSVGKTFHHEKSVVSVLGN